MEGAATEALVTELVGGDERFLSLGPDGLDALTLDDVRTAVQAQLRPDLLELSVVGDFASFEEVGGFVGEILFGSWWGGGGPPIPAHEVVRYDPIVSFCRDATRCDSFVVSS